VHRLGPLADGRPECPIEVVSRSHFDDLQLQLQRVGGKTCNARRTAQWLRLSDAGNAVHLSHHDTLVSFPQADGGVLERHPVCLPDTVDPRGPKGR
jgi:hypothetical protein